MAATQGYGGSITWGAGIFSDTATNARSWSLDFVADVHDVTDFSSTGDRTFIGGLRTWTGTWECLLDGTLDPLLGTGASLGGAAVTVTLQASTGRTYAGSATVTGIHASVNVDSPNIMSVDVQGTGALTLA